MHTISRGGCSRCPGKDAELARKDAELARLRSLIEIYSRSARTQRFHISSLEDAYREKVATLEARLGMARLAMPKKPKPKPRPRPY